MARRGEDSWFTHIAISVPNEGASAEWLEPVADEEYEPVKLRIWMMNESLLSSPSFETKDAEKPENGSGRPRYLIK